MVDPGEGPGGPSPLFLHQTEVQRVEKNFLEAALPLSLSKGLDDRDPPYLQVWMWHWDCSTSISIRSSCTSENSHDISFSIRRMQGFDILVFIPMLTSRLPLLTHKPLMFMLMGICARC